MTASEKESEESVRADVEAARAELLQIDRELSVINEALERLMNDDTSNRLQLSVSKVSCVHPCITI
jgi:outer membrane protein TolC